MADDDVELRFGASLEGLQAGIEEAKEQVEGLSGPISGIVDSFKELGEALAAALAVEKIAEFTEEMGELGERTERMSKILGISTEQVGELNYAAVLTGTSTENLTTMISRFEAGLGAADKGTGRVAAGLKALGLSAEELRKLDPSQQLREIAEATAKVGDGAAKAAALNDLGRGFAQWIPLLDEGAEGFDELTEKARAAGVALSPEVTSKLVEMQHGMVNLKEEIVGATVAGFNPFIGVVNVAVGWLSQLTTAFTESATHGGLVKQSLDILADAFRVIESLINDTITALQIMGATATYVVSVASSKFYEFADAISAVVKDLANLDPHFSSLGAVAHQGAQDATDAWNDLEKSISAAMKANDEAAHKIFKGSPLAGIFGFHPGVDPRAGEAAGVPTGGSDSSYKPQPPFPVEETKGKQDNSALKAAEEEAAAEIKLATDAANQREAILDGELKQRQITTSQWLAGTKDALADELQDTIATYQAELQTANLTAQQRKAISDKIAEAEAENAVKVTKAEQKAADETTKSWLTAGDAIAGIFNSQVNGLLKGTETIAQAFRSMAASVIEDIIKIIIKLAAEAAALEALSLATGGQLGGFGAGGIGGFLAGALHFAEGTPYVQNTGLAVLHAGEMVTPADLNPNNPANSLSFSGNRSGGGSGGGVTNHTHHWGGVHVDTGGRDLDPAEVAKAMDKAVRSGAHTKFKSFAR